MLDELIVMGALMLSVAIPANAQQLSIGIGTPNLNIGINLPMYPDLVPVPGYPVYYAPQVDSNYFFYDGMYWVYRDDNWYASSWYNGPWGAVGPEYVPLYILRIPVRYYRQPPMYFRGWQSNSPPRWGEHWGNDWSQRHNGWDHWNRNAAPPRPPLPLYQRKYSGDRYPRVEQQQVLQDHNYHYRPHDNAVRQQYQAQRAHSAPQPQPAQQHEGQNVIRDNRSVQQNIPRPNPPAQVIQNRPSVIQSRPTAPVVRTPQAEVRHAPQQRPQPDQNQAARQQREQRPVQQHQPAQRESPQPQQGGHQEPRQEHGSSQGNDRGRGDDHGQDRKQ